MEPRMGAMDAKGGFRVAMGWLELGDWRTASDELEEIEAGSQDEGRGGGAALGASGP